MGKNLIQQKRGKGGPTWRANGFNSEGDVKLPHNKTSATVIDLITSRFHSAPLATVKYNDGEEGLLMRRPRRLLSSSMRRTDSSITRVESFSICRL